MKQPKFGSTHVWPGESSRNTEHRGSVDKQFCKSPNLLEEPRLLHTHKHTMTHTHTVSINGEADTNWEMMMMIPLVESSVQKTDK